MEAYLHAIVKADQITNTRNRRVSALTSVNTSDKKMKTIKKKKRSVSNLLQIPPVNVGPNPSF